MTRCLKDNLICAGMMPPDHLAPAPKIADQFGVTRRTLGRWILDAALAFPRPVEINKRLYFKQSEIDEWKIQRARRDLPVNEAA